MFKWLKRGGRKERGWQFWVKLFVTVVIIMGVVTVIFYYMIQGGKS